MARRSLGRRAEGVAWAMGLALLVGAGGCAAPEKPVADRPDVAKLAGEVERLKEEVALLFQRLEAEQRSSRAAHATPACSSAALVEPAAKRDLVLPIRPSRQLDPENPWVAAK